MAYQTVQLIAERISLRVTIRFWWESRVSAHSTW